MKNSLIKMNRRDIYDSVTLSVIEDTGNQADLKQIQLKLLYTVAQISLGEYSKVQEILPHDIEIVTELLNDLQAEQEASQAGEQMS